MSEDIEIELEEPAAEIEAAESPIEGEKKIIEPEEGIEKVREQLARERQDKLEAQAVAARAIEETSRARTEVQDTNLTLVTNAIAQFKQSNDVLKSSLAQAMAEQDFEKAADIQVQIMDNTVKLSQLETGKQKFEAKPESTVERSFDPVESYVSDLTKNGAPNSAAWVRSHPEYVRDPRMNRQMIRAHEDAMDEGIKPDTPAYFAAVEKKLGLAQERQVSPAAAPVTRSGGAATTNPNRVRLSPAQIEAAEASGLTPQEYARNMLALQKEGKIQ